MRIRRHVIPTLALLAACSRADNAVVSDSLASKPAAVTERSQEPLSPPQKLVPVLSIGEADGPDEYSFSYVGDIALGAHDAMYVWEYGSMRIREYDSTGKYVRTFGRTGSGPGEYARGVNGLAVRDDGKLLAWDAGNARINLYSPKGKPESQWPAHTVGFTARALFTDTAGNSYVRMTWDTKTIGPAPTSFLRFDRAGSLLDTLRPPDFGLQRPQMLAQRPGGRGGRYADVPYFPEVQAAVMRNGDLVAGPGRTYLLQIFRNDATVGTIKRNVLPPLIDDEERNEKRETVLASMREVNPGFQWTGPDIPQRKPAYTELLVDEDDRIWVKVSQPSERIPESERVKYPGSTLPVRTWRESVAYDILSRDGELLGHVRMPAKTTFFRARGNRMWTTTLDSMDFPTITVFKLEPGLHSRARTR